MSESMPNLAEKHGFIDTQSMSHHLRDCLVDLEDAVNHVCERAMVKPITEIASDDLKYGFSAVLQIIEKLETHYEEKVESLEDELAEMHKTYTRMALKIHTGK